MTGLEIAALIAMLAGTGLQYKASTDAQQRAEEQTRLALQRQDDLNQQAEKKAMDTAKTFNTDDRAAQQNQITDQLTQEFTQPVETAQAINNEQSTTQGNVSDDYTAAKARSNLNVAKSSVALARMMAKVTGANRLRTDEAIRMADTAANIDRLGGFARGNRAADEIAIQNAARPDAGLQLAGGALSALGYYGLASGAGTASTGAVEGTTGVGAKASTSSASLSNTANMNQPLAATTTGSTGFTTSGGTGLRMSQMPKSYYW